MKRLRTAVDVGGTFTDVCVFDEETRSMRVTKVASTPDNPMEAVLKGIEHAEIDLHDVELFSHGTTVATNALITRNFPRAAMVTTQGFRDVIEIRDGTKADLWDAYNDVSGPYIRRRDRFEISERVDYSGRVLTPLDEDGARQLARLLKKRGVETIAVCFINSYVNASNERRMREILEEEIPDARVTASAEVLPEIFEHPRFNTAVANALLGPLVSDYMEELDERLSSSGYANDLLLLHSGGGSMTPSLAKRLPVRLAASGIAAGAIAAKHVADERGYNNVIGLDMGGTSTDISLVADGELRTTSNWGVEYGHPIVFPSIEVLTIGSGGGSLAHIDRAGALRNGPRSAGADPGPACYKKGGTEPTNTDANLFLGRLGTSLAGGTMSLDSSLSEKAITETIAAPLGLTPERAALSILQVANANIADAVRLVSIRRGLDPREFTLIAFGGAGALHGAEVAKELGMPSVIVPPSPGVTSAMGCLLVDIQHDFSEMYVSPVSEVNSTDLEAAFQRLEDEAKQRLRAEGVSIENSLIQRGISMRYQGQWRSLQVPFAREASDLEDTVQTFHEEHERQFAFRQDQLPVEIYQIHVKAIGHTPRPSFTSAPKTDEALPNLMLHRDVYFDGEWQQTPIYDRSMMKNGMRLKGPVIINQPDATTVIPPGTEAAVDEWLNIHISL
jgi:N-methylhydantoinase A